MGRILARAKALVVVVALVIGLFKFVDWAAEYLWFEALGYESVFWTLRFTKLTLFAAALIPALLYFWLNFRLLARHLDLIAVFRAVGGQLSGQPQAASASTGGLAQAATDPRRRAAARDLGFLLAVLIALVFALIYYGSWDRLLRLLWSGPLDLAEPIYSHDIGFYLFMLPFLELVQNSFLAATLTTSAVVFLSHAYGRTLRFSRGQGLGGPPEVLRQLKANLTLLLLALAWGFHLDRYDLLLTASGAVWGANYADVHFVRPALTIAVGATLALAAVLWFPRLYKSSTVLITVAGGYVLMLAVGVGVLPWGVQQFVVKPNELELEMPYLEHNIAFTRRAFQLDRLDVRSYEASDVLDLADIRRNRHTIDNIRLWDWDQVGRAYRQLQQIRTYYQFNNVDVDRYRIGDTYRQVILAARELSEELPDRADTWVNRHLQYTHGYGLVMSFAASKDEHGSPALIVKDVPPRTDGGLSVIEPAIYYGETMSGYRIVDSAVPEFDFPRGDENVYRSYGGQGGVALGAFWRRLLFAWHQFDPSILLTSSVTEASRIQLWRRVRERTARLAPFLRLDKDPYLVLDEGRLYWIQDAYTVATSYPYSEPQGGAFNYIRNPVKVVIDAYDGAIDFYVIDEEDPVLALYRRAMPTLFRPLAEMPEGIRRHLRYPQDLFELQVAAYSTYT